LIQDIKRILQHASDGRPHFSDTDATPYYPSMNAGEFQRTDTVAVELPPTREIAYFAQVANFHLNANYFFFNLDYFLKKIDQNAHVSDSVDFVLTKTSLLLVVALGKLFLGVGHTPSAPPGAREFSLAAHILPSNLAMTQSLPDALESLCLAAMYAHIAAIHDAAYTYVSRDLPYDNGAMLTASTKVGQAVRLSRLSGSDRANMRPPEARHAERDICLLGLTARILDQRISATVGYPADYHERSRHDSFLGPPTPGDDPLWISMRINASIAHHLSKITLRELQNTPLSHST
jgi:hypothetical protein